MRILKNRAFNKWAEKQGVNDSILLKMAREMQQNLYEVNLRKFMEISHG